MKALIQHNFTSGLGDFVADVSHYMTILEEVKKSGYEIHLRISLKSNKYVMGSFFSELFDEKTLSFFDSIKETVDTNFNREYEGCIYFGSNHAPQEPGRHHFDIFFDVVPKNFKFNVFDAQRVHLNNHIPTITPSPNSEIMKMVESFWKKLPDQYSFLHIRTSDIIDSDTIRYDRIIQRVESYISGTNIFFHLGTNNKYIFDKLKTNPNVFVYEFQNYDIVNNDMNAFTNGLGKPEIKSEILISRIKEIFSEMVSIRKATNIFYVYDISWISNFVFYPLVTSENKIFLINKNEWRA